MTNLMSHVGRIVGEMSPESEGYLKHVQTGYERGASDVKSEHGLGILRKTSRAFRVVLYQPPIRTTVCRVR